MLKDITIGRYIYGTSPLHRMDAGMKIILTLVYAAAVFMLESPVSYFVYILFTALLVFMSRISLKMLVKGFSPLLWLFVFTAIFNIFFVPGREIVRVFSLKITYEGIVQTIQLGLRLILLLTGTSLLTLTTPPLQMTDGIEKLLRPLKRFRVPSHEIAMMMSIAIRFIPIIGDEAGRLVKAQKARGADMESGGVIKRAKAMIPIIIPLLSSSFRRADELATAMDARCYNGDKRTRMKETHMGKIDAYAAVIVITVSVIAVIISFIG